MTRRQSRSGENGDGEVDGPVKLQGQRAAELLRAEVLDGTLAPGSRVRQEELAARLGLSRIPVREALRQLEAEGLVVVVPNSGAWIAQVNLRECMEIYKIRERLEPMALAESLEHMSDRDIQELEELVVAIEKSTTVEDFLRLDREFHLASYKRSPMPLLQTMIEGFWNKTQHYRRAYTTTIGSANRWIINAEHKLMLEAIRNRDAEDVERVLQSHIRRTRIQLSRNSELFR
jgi:DNA-binding GntR family transcriptional regulator